MGSGGTEVPFNGGKPQPLSEPRIRHIAKLDLHSTRWMSETEKINNTRQMIFDLERLVTQDGCIAAAWALEWIETVSKNILVADLTTLR
jgi:hypothetical protein